MTKQKNKIPIKGYATFDPLKHCWIGSGFNTDWFKDLAIYKNNKIMDPLKRIADETEEDYQKLEKILRDASVQTHRSFLNVDKVKSLEQIQRPPMTPRDYFAVIGNKIYCCNSGQQGFADVLKQIDRQDIVFTPTKGAISTANIVRVGKDLYWDRNKDKDGFMDVEPELFEKTKNELEAQGFRIHLSYRGYHSDGVYCVVKPGCIVSVPDLQDYAKLFPGWDVLTVPHQDWYKMSPFLNMKRKVGGKWWVKGEEHNDQLIEFVNTWLNDWVGYVEETVFDVNMLSIDQDTIICNNYNKDVFEYFKKHKVEPILFNFRHRYFWDGGVHCVTQDLYREGTMEDYFG